jgi:hypothetical protein
MSILAAALRSCFLAADDHDRREGRRLMDDEDRRTDGAAPCAFGGGAHVGDARGTRRRSRARPAPSVLIRPVPVATVAAIRPRRADSALVPDPARIARELLRRQLL